MRNNSFEFGPVVQELSVRYFLSRALLAFLFSRVEPLPQGHGWQDSYRGPLYIAIY